MQVSDDQSKRAFCIAIFNRELNKRNICPANHDVDYANGWFYMDGENVGQRPDYTAEADQMMKTGSHRVLYWPEGNTYVIDYNPDYRNPDYDDPDPTE